MVGRTIDRYTLVEKLGAGGMGDVYKGHHTSLDQYRAIKVLPAHLSRNPELVERFMREARHYAGLSHPNIVRVEHVGDQDGDYFMVMDYVQGHSLREIIDDRGPLPVERGISIALQVCEALAHAHERGVIHRDVKPSNVLIAPERAGERAVLTDFGIARGLEPEEPGLTAAGISVGTPEYMSPEQIRGEPLDGRSDLYSLGVVLYEMFTGELPFAARSKANVKRMHLEKVPDPPRTLVPELPSALEELILRALEKNPSRRPASARAMGEALMVLRAEPTGPRASDRPPADAAPGGYERPPTGAPSEGPAWDTRSTPLAFNRSSLSSERDSYDERPTPIGQDTLGAAATIVGGQTRVPPQARPDKSETSRIPPMGAWIARIPKLPPYAPLAAGALLIGLSAGLLQALGNGAAADRFAAEKRVDPRTGKEFGVVLGHGVPLFVITRPEGDLTPAQRAERAAQKLTAMLRGENGKPLGPETVAAVVNGRGEAVLSRKGNAGKEPDPDDVIVTVDADTADGYAGTDRASLATWWRDVLRDHLRLARGKPPVSTFDSQHGRILDRIHQEVEDERSGDWIPAGEIRKAFDDLSEPHRDALQTAWRTVPKAWANGGNTLPVQAGLVAVPRQNVSVSDADPGHPGRYLIDNHATTAWQARHGVRHHGHNHWIKIQVPTGYRVAEVHLREGSRARSQYQLRLKQAKVTLSDGSTHRIWRASPSDPLRLTMPARATRWVKVEAERYFRHPDPHESHLYLSEVKLWGM